MGKLWIGTSNGCWVEVFDAERYQGRLCRLYGPGDFRALRIGEQGWNESAGSLIVGPGAYVQLFDEETPLSETYWLVPGQQVGSVAELAFPEDYHSLRLFDRPPFGHERGYLSYLRCAGIATIEEPSTPTPPAPRRARTGKRAR